MAMAQNHTEIVTCPVCFSIYDNPFLLSCMHTVCSKCLIYTTNNNSKLANSSPSGFTCPICKTKVKDATKDHSKQAVVDMYQKHTSFTIERTTQKDTQDTLEDPPTNGKAGQLTCQACMIDSTVVKWKCTGCSKLMCSGCRSVHDKLPSCGDHRVMSLEDAVLEERVRLREAQHASLAMQRTLCEQIQNVVNFQKEITKAKAEALTRLDEYKDLIIRDVNAMHKRLKDEVEEAETRLREPLLDGESMLLKQKEKLDTRLSVISRIIDTQDCHTFLQHTNENDLASKDSDITDEVEVFSAPVLDIAVDYNRDVDLGKLVTVNIKTLSFQRQASHSVDSVDAVESTQDYSTLVQNMYSLEKAIPLKYSPRKLVMVDDKLWCAGPSAIYIHDKAGAIIKTVTHAKLQQIKSLTETCSGHVIVACWDSKGLLQIDKHGTLEAKVHDGSFSDVTSNKGDVYALSYGDCQVLSFQFEENRWCYKKSVNVSYNNGNNWDSLCYNRGSLYVCSWGNHRIYQFSLDGKLLHQFGSYTHLGAIQFNHPRICDIDNVGNILIADVDNDRLQVYDNSKGQWSVVNTSGFVKRPHDAVVDDADCHTLWMIQNTPGSVNRIYKFTTSALWDSKAYAKQMSV